MTYRPTIDDLNMYLQVTVEYKDRAGPKTQKVQQVSPYPVREDTNTSNDPPKYPGPEHTDWGGSTDCRLAYTRKDGYGQVHTRDRGCGNQRRRAGDGLRRRHRYR